MRAAVVIPARHASSRFPGKPLVKLLEKPMVLWVADLSSVAVGVENVYVATDSKRIADVVESAGYSAVITSSDALTGTDRLAEVVGQIDADIYVNVQGDEPMVDPKDICRVIAEKQAHMDMVVNAYCDISSEEDPLNINIPKVVVSESQKLLYMSRAAVPGSKSGSQSHTNFQKQVCIYAFTGEELMAFRSFGRKSELESFEDIEILRFFELNKEILMIEVQGGSLAVDVPDDVAKVERALRL